MTTREIPESYAAFTDDLIGRTFYLEVSNSGSYLASDGLYVGRIDEFPVFVGIKRKDHRPLEILWLDKNERIPQFIYPPLFVSPDTGELPEIKSSPLGGRFFPQLCDELLGSIEDRVHERANSG